MITIVLVASSDADTIKQISKWEEAQWGVDGVVSTDKPYAIAAAYEDDKLVGSAVLAERDLSIKPHIKPWVASVFVLPEHRGQGIATMLVQKLEEEAKRLKFETIWLYTEEAHTLYVRLGWKFVESLMYKKAPITVMRKLC